MAKKKKFKPSKKFFKDLGDEVRDKIEATGKKGKGINGNFPAYTSKYATLKAEGKASPEGVSVSSKSTKPDLTLTGDMWMNLSATSTDNDVKVGWTDKSQAGKVQGNAERGRAVFTEDKIAEPVEELIDELFQKEMKKQTKKLKQKVVNLFFKK